ncbi:hypothetical protein AC1031_016818 [Aphanomyces cochlioides]|nr:hypothetical protein AC1031_016818 [Aphanomyces cochlioides]
MRVQSKGRVLGQPNFKVEEDMALAKAYCMETTCAAIGTDQFGDTFWGKVAARYHTLVAENSSKRSAVSLTNRFNGTLANKTNNGWQYNDYVEQAQVNFALSNDGHRFKHEEVYKILSKLPKYSVSLDQINSKVTDALGLDIADFGDGTIEPVIQVAERPNEGKKLAKKRKIDLSDDKMNQVSQSELEALKQATAAAREKNVLLKESLAIQRTNARISFFQQQPNSIAAQAFFDIQAKRFLAEMEAEEEHLSSMEQNDEFTDQADENSM